MKSMTDPDFRPQFGPVEHPGQAQPPLAGGPNAALGTARGRPWIGVRFVCAGKYVRVFRSGDGAGYLARCPTCARTMWFRVGAEGTSERFFELTCR